MKSYPDIYQYVDHWAHSYKKETHWVTISFNNSNAYNLMENILYIWTNGPRTKVVPILELL
jgi:hypothetical protein